MTFDEKIKILSNILEVFEIVSGEEKYQLAGIIMGYSLATQHRKQQMIEESMLWIY